MRLYLHQYFAYASSEGYGESAHIEHPLITGGISTKISCTCPYIPVEYVCYQTILFLFSLHLDFHGSHHPGTTMYDHLSSIHNAMSMEHQQYILVGYFSWGFKTLLSQTFKSIKEMFTLQPHSNVLILLQHMT